MKPIPSFNKFEEIGPLEGRISIDEAEKLAELFASYTSVNESGFFDSIKNTLSKTFLGSLSYINMIDKVRTEIVKLKKELISKRYAFKDEISSLRDDIKEFSKSKNESGIQRTEKTISMKKKEFEIFEKMIDNRIEKAMSTLKDIVKGNKRRMEYFEAGESADELEILEYEYSLLKQNSNTPESQTEIKKMEEEILKAKEEAEKAKKDLEFKAKEASQKKSSTELNFGSDSPNYNKILRSKEARKSLILKLKNHIAFLEDKIEDSKGFNKGELQRTLAKVKKDLQEVQKIHNQLGSKKVINTEKEFTNIIDKLGKDLRNTDIAREKVTSMSNDKSKSTSSKAKSVKK